MSVEVQYGRRIYLHGLMSLLCVAIIVLTGLAGLYLWKPFYLIALGFGLMAGWHIGNALFAATIRSIDTRGE